MTSLGPLHCVVNEHCGARVSLLRAAPDAGHAKAIYLVPEGDVREIVRAGTSKTKLRIPISSACCGHLAIPVPVVGQIQDIQKIRRKDVRVAGTKLIGTNELEQ